MKKNLLIAVSILLLSSSYIKAQTGKDVPYGTDPFQKLDYYKASAPNSPVIILVHPGGWVAGSKDDPDFFPVAQLFNDTGYAVVNINYRLAGKGNYSGFPDQPNDLDSAIKWTKLNAARKLNGDSSKVVLYGHSSGGHLATLHGLRNTSSFLNVNATLATSGVYDFDALNPKLNKNVIAMLGDSAIYRNDAQPIFHDAANVNTKFLCLTGTEDNYLGTQQALNFRDSMMAHRQCLSFYYLEGYTHRSLLTPMTDTSLVFRIMINFLDSLWLNKLCVACAAPTALNTTNITATSAVLNWNAVNGAASYSIQYRKANTTNSKNITAANTRKKVTGLSSNTTYEWRVRTVCSSGTSKYSAFITFTTLPSLLTAQLTSAEKLETRHLRMYPNPAKDNITIEFTGTAAGIVKINVCNATGQRVLHTQSAIFKGSNIINLNTSGLTNGIYIVQLENNRISQHQKFMIAK